MSAQYCYIRVPHFMSHSGYERVAAAHRAAVGRPVEVSLPGGGARWPRHAVLRYPQRLVRFVSGLDEYSFAALTLEARTMLRLARSRGQIFHFLYGENFCRYSPYVSGWRENRVVASFHQTPAQLEQRLRTTTHLRHLAAVIILGENQRPFFESHVTADRVHFVPHGVDTRHFVPSGERPVREEPLCVCVGGHLRDFGTLAEAIRQINAAGERIRFEAVARGDQKEALAGLDNVHVREWVTEEEMLRLYQNADVLVMSLDDAVASNVLLEGMACAAPIVVTDVGAVRDYVSDDACVLAPRLDAGRLADGIVRLARDPDLARRLGGRARQRAEQLDHAIVAERLQTVYDGLAMQS